MDCEARHRKINELLLLNWKLEVDKERTKHAILVTRAAIRHRRLRERRLLLEKVKKKRSVWVRSWLARRPQLGQYARLMNELKDEDRKGFCNFLRMDYELYREILHRIDDRITGVQLNYREPLSPGIKLAITLRYLATGDSYHSLMYGFRVAHNTISKVVIQVCEAILAEFCKELTPFPKTQAQWKDIAGGFKDRWQLPHCIGALDGKHVAIRCPPSAGSLYYNYKGFFSVILMALVDSDYKFLWADVGCHGSAGDAQVFNHGELKKALEENSIGIPPPEPLPDGDTPVPYYIAADDAFALRTWLMKPFSKRKMDDAERIFNYRLSRGRRIVENAFGILAHRFRCLLTTMQQKPDNVTTIVLTCINLHNLMRMRNKDHTRAGDQEDSEHRVIPGEWRQDTPLTDGISFLNRNTTTNAAKKQRDYLCQYFNSDAGSVPWQMDMI